MNNPTKEDRVNMIVEYAKKVLQYPKDSVNYDPADAFNLRMALEKYDKEQLNEVVIFDKNNLRKVKSFDPPCSSPEHFPPKFMVYEPGEYEYTCPQCGHVTKFTVQLVTF